MSPAITRTMADTLANGLDLAAGIDLLRERRLELGLADPQVVLAQQRHQLARGFGWATVLAGGVALLGVLLTMRYQFVVASLDRVALVEAKVAELEQDLTTRKQAMQGLRTANDALAKALVSNRSGSALMRDLQLRMPQGVQLNDVKTVGESLQIAGVARDPLSFARINALQLQLQRSPLLLPNGLTLVKAERNALDPRQPEKASQIAFQITATLRPPLPGPQEVVILRELGADGMVRRLQLLQREGLLQ